MGSHMGVIGCLLAAAALLHSATAATHVVLGNSGWFLPTNGDGTYSTWAAGQDFRVGDTLVFDFPTGLHAVAEVTKAGYDSCNGASPLSSQTTGPASITLATSGEHYYICTVDGHCLSGMKLAITVKTAPVTVTPPAPTIPTVSSPASGPSPPRPGTPPTPLIPRVSSPASAPSPPGPGTPPAPLIPIVSSPATPGPGTPPAPLTPRVSSPSIGPSPPSSASSSITIGGIISALLSTAIAFLY
ncbi:hypothetical protein IFM89_008308 [Coptis chinensis]|uniref:Phytocyanin domain-containing protein n=1 Tax=Coptis chinensis TaxID=261450 RepID=A0A835I9R8_9MAGN|nr:hypothetical protein IFM89_008308 [Coptis chinensis]